MKRDFNILLMYKKEINCKLKVVRNKKRYNKKKERQKVKRIKYDY